MNPKVRVRFAPSPTGPLHIGGVRTALFNYLFAKKHGGDFILRIEDTDQNRYVEGAEQYIIDSLNWCGIPFDEGPASTTPGDPASTTLSDPASTTPGDLNGKYGPYRQSERKQLYKKYADQLVASGKAYYAFDTQEELDFHRKDHESKGKTFIYNWHNRLKLSNSLTLSDSETREKLASDQEHVIRFKSPRDEKLLLNDIIRGQIEIDTNVLDDKVLFKSDGMPTYHLANVVDDHLMEISHVIRGEEWLPSLPLHHLLYDAFGWECPKFAHLPLIMKPVGKGKLSKRDGEKLGFPVFPLSWGTSKGYREEGYFPEAIINFLALLGWNPGTEQEIFTLRELIEAFDLDRVNKSGARFDPEKIKWYNHQYMQLKEDRELASGFLPLLNDKLIENKDKDNAPPDITFTTKVISLVKERATFVTDFWDLGDYFFVPPAHYNEKAVKKQWKQDTPIILAELISQIENVEKFTSANLESDIKNWIGGKELSFGKVMPPLRLVIVGDMKGPHLFDIMELIGKEESIRRIRRAIPIL